MILVIDNYDCFTYNLVQFLGELGADVRRRAQRRVDAPDELLAARATSAASSRPAPCTPDEAGISLEAIAQLPRPASRCSGVCLGHQALAPGVRRPRGRCAARRCTARPTAIDHDGRGSSPACRARSTAARYHSLIVDPRPARRPGGIRADGDGVVMGLRHRELPAEGVQFHPESVLTAEGKHLLANFLAMAGDAQPGSIRMPDILETTA